jgi:hypothetical protein
MEQRRKGLKIFAEICYPPKPFETLSIWTAVAACRGEAAAKTGAQRRHRFLL